MVLRARVVLSAIAGAVVLALTAGRATAETPPAPPADAVTFADVLQALRDRSPRLAIEEAEVAAARGDLVTARALPNPSVAYSTGALVDGANVNGAWQHQATVAMPLPITGARGARTEAAEKKIAVAEQRRHARWAELALAARKLFVDLLAAEERERVLEDAHRDVEHLRDIVAGRVHEGMAREYDGVRVATEAQLMEAKAADARADALDKSGQLGTLIGLADWHPRALGELRPLGTAVDAVADPRVVEASQPALAVAKSEEAAAAADLEVAKRERWPLPTLSAGALETRHETSTSFVGGLEVEVPLFDRGQGKIERSRAEAEEASAARRVTTAETAAELDRATRLLRERRTALAAFDREVGDRLPTLRRMAEDAYRTGQGGIVELLDATQARTEAQLAGVALVQSVVQAEVDVLGAAGVADTVLP